MDAASIVGEFFHSYAEALLARDVSAIAGFYACPALIAFPGQTIAVTDPAQTTDFFRRAVAQYEGVTEAASEAAVLATTEHSIWADVTWSYTGGATPGERLCYQLLATDAGWRIGVLTPLS